MENKKSNFKLKIYNMHVKHDIYDQKQGKNAPKQINNCSGNQPGLAITQTNDS